ncbi:MAG: GNAT family N-acetyltransferase [Betaproteobacteria bacterium]
MGIGACQASTASARINSRRRQRSDAFLSQPWWRSVPPIRGRETANYNVRHRTGGHRVSDQTRVNIANTIRQAASSDDIATARTLFLEYAAWLTIDLCFQNFNEELAALPGAYAPPSGRLLLAGRDNRSAAGCVALRRLDPDPSGATCELKRLWVRPDQQRQHVGRALTEAALAAARDIGYASMKLDTLPAVMPAAVALYRSLGFTDCAPYYHNPIPGSLYMECALRR